MQQGGVASGFNHAEINDYSEIQRLLWVRGRQQVRADEVPFEWSSLNKSDCFIIDMGNVSYFVSLIYCFSAKLSHVLSVDFYTCIFLGYLPMEWSESKSIRENQMRQVCKLTPR